MLINKNWLQLHTSHTHTCLCACPVLMLCCPSLAIFSCFGIIKKLNLVPILANEKRCAETVHVQIRICIIGKDNINLLLTHNNTVVLKEKFSFFFLPRIHKSWSAAGKHCGACRESRCCSGTVNLNHLVVGQNISLLTVPPFSLPQFNS